ncbi:hypothetical protein B0T26DRAFT_751310 [Lasiosphaeria miniovina]|uniref:Uncharacterized protein n=1 Tax=Lasiosphaeria miniovina TaxID=1954250 RepID=A0AA40DY21_9PEZI|nr:uncharacterized protein B0T26DRAFT_751310 [Lasiosphaeria miniovina]KAK0717231.1 hypothetical protein B0T26DRAFT_751310 [Lasiosphaeria miniovina]
MVEDLHATITRVRIALLQSQVREKGVPTAAVPVAASHSPVRRRRSTVTAVYSGSKDGVPLFTKQKVVRVVS